MRQLTLIFTFLLFSFKIFGQNKIETITPQILEKIVKEVETEIPNFRTKLEAKNFSKIEIEFAIDTFRIEQISSKKMDIDYSNSGMIENIIQLTIDYDKLMNKYYSRLIKVLKEDDKIKLINAQKAWLKFRDEEKKFASIMMKNDYSDGGELAHQSVISNNRNIVSVRTIDIFLYYNDIVSFEEMKK